MDPHHNRAAILSCLFSGSSHALAGLLYERTIMFNICHALKESNLCMNIFFESSQREPYCYRVKCARKMMGEHGKHFCDSNQFRGGESVRHYLFANTSKNIETITTNSRMRSLTLLFLRVPQKIGAPIPNHHTFRNSSSRKFKKCIQWRNPSADVPL